MAIGIEARVSGEGATVGEYQEKRQSTRNYFVNIY